MEVKKQKLLLMLQPTSDMGVVGKELCSASMQEEAEGGMEKEEVDEFEELDDLVGMRCRAPLKEVS